MRLQLTDACIHVSRKKKYTDNCYIVFDHSFAYVISINQSIKQILFSVPSRSLFRGSHGPGQAEKWHSVFGESEIVWEVLYSRGKPVPCLQTNSRRGMVLRCHYGQKSLASCARRKSTGKALAEHNPVRDAL